jgi:hypothetical protein
VYREETDNEVRIELGKVRPVCEKGDGRGMIIESGELNPRKEEINDGVEVWGSHTERR